MARKTLESARGDCERGDYNWACFKSQQAAEAAVKGLLHGLGLDAYGHSISRLLERLRARGLDTPNKLINMGKTLDKYYIPTRYPNAWAEGSPHDYYTEKDASESIEYAEKIIKWVVETWRYLEKGGE